MAFNATKLTADAALAMQTRRPESPRACGLGTVKKVEAEFATMRDR